VVSQPTTELERADATAAVGVDHIEELVQVVLKLPLRVLDAIVFYRCIRLHVMKMEQRPLMRH
jgi:hypothetical protein